ncbi:hypothetical protein KAFR_0K00600 [Kazachstania africana CBS 2517]|uniref:Myosin motor domain-containing protein n=1 Tax=Kazachstania africana (strain ATCC 22294 / BCRC 22015 / CBS 2517 / CECT 1963 / NBRC 1671 / NRRL Y-8276) TaxID=1071382 RepID=H2B1B5_KAZAF|nr:hypothetical protein KAFR_0K00600 [Kazachstania africana CBS 2517]CCF60415.1 hypothetical protein KAFR_0K00600 [Kazachstania africana CBS 2517]
MSFEVGTRCWYPSSDLGWIGGEITKYEHTDHLYRLELTLEDGTVIPIETETLDASTTTVTENADSVLPLLRNPPILEDTDDLTSLSYLNEPAVLHAIKKRYSMKNIYTYSGIVLIAANPFDKIDGLYTDDMIQKYATQKREELEPHIFAIADEAYREMINNNQNQTIVVSGESGAGKTVSAKYIMRYFASLEEDASSKKGDLQHQIEMSEIERKILATNPIMEAFGNAKTTRNDNSSRFGKYLEILFDNSSKIIGAKIRTYLLERSRLVFQPESERNYHIFYQMIMGLPQHAKSQLNLKEPEHYYYLNQGNSMIIAGVDDKEEFQTTSDSLALVGLNKDVQLEIFKILASLLHIGNIEIKKTRNEASLTSDEPNLIIACELLGIDPSTFSKWITKKQIRTRSEKIVSNLTYAQSLVARDSFAKFIYSALFDWLVENINVVLGSEDNAKQAKSLIGVLDIYGFEHFEKNSFEQFCINYANEKLQQEFNQHVFKLEQEEYIREEIQWSFIEFNDNQPCISLLENRLGIFSLLDEESRLPSGSDESWTDKLYQTFNKPPTNAVFSKPRFGQTKFIVSHYAHDVTYDVEGFIEKNRDTVSEGHMEVLHTSSNDTLRSILENLTALENASQESPKEENNKLGGVARKNIQRKPTLGSIFKQSLQSLMETINSTNVHYIRCIKPNAEKKAWSFDNSMVLSQLRACGVLETIKISCAGFPSRWTFGEFFERYYFLADFSEWLPIMSNQARNEEDLIAFNAKILEKTIKEEKYQIGKTKIFFKAGMLAFLENLRKAKLTWLCVIIQKKIRGRLCRLHYLKTLESIRSLQNLVKTKLVREEVIAQLKLRAATFIQSYIRGKNTYSLYRETLTGTLKIQSKIRSVLVKRERERKRRANAAIFVQRKIKTFRQRNKFMQLQKNVITVQSFVRRAQAMKEFAKLKEESLIKCSPALLLQKEFIEFVKLLTERIKQNKEANEYVKQLEGNASIKALLNDTSFENIQDMIEEKRLVIERKKEEINSLMFMRNSFKSNAKAVIDIFNKTTDDNLNKEGGTFVSPNVNKITQELQTYQKLMKKLLDGSTGDKSRKSVGLLASTGDQLIPHNAPIPCCNDDSADFVARISDMNEEIQKFFNVANGISDDNLNESSTLTLSEVVISVMEGFLNKHLHREGHSFTVEFCKTFNERVTMTLNEKTDTAYFFWLKNFSSICSYLYFKDEVLSKCSLLMEIKREFSTCLVTLFESHLDKLIKSFNEEVSSSDILFNTNHSSKDVQTNSTEKLIYFLNRTYGKMESNGLNPRLKNAVLLQLFGYIDSVTFNDVLTKVYELTWQVGFELDKHVQEIYSWCNEKEIRVSIVRSFLPYSRQLAKVLQLRISNLQDLGVVREFSYSLTPSQLHAILKRYKPSKYEFSIPAEVMNYLTNIVKKDKLVRSDTNILLSTGLRRIADVSVLIEDRSTLSEIVDLHELDMPTIKHLLQLQKTN